MIDNPAMPKPWYTERGQPWNTEIRGFDNNNRFPFNNPDGSKWVRYTIYGAGAVDLGKRLYEGMNPEFQKGIATPSDQMFNAIISNGSIPVITPVYAPYICPADATKLVLPLKLNYPK